MSEAGVIRFLSQILVFSLTQDLENLLEPEMRKKYWGYVMDTAMTMELASPSISLIETGQGKAPASGRYASFKAASATTPITWQAVN